MRLRLTLLQRFSLLVLLATLAISILLGLMISAQIESEAVTHASTELRDVLRLRNPFWLRLNDVEMEFARTHDEPADYERWSYNIKSALAGYPIYRIKVWSPKGQIIWSDDRGLIGESHGENTDLIETLREGTVHAEITDLSKLENMTDGVNGRVLEMYMPVLGPNSFEVIGAFELYQEIEDTYVAIETAQQEMWKLIGVLMMTFYLALFFLLAQTSRNLTRLQRVAQLERYFSPGVAQAIAFGGGDNPHYVTVPVMGRSVATVLFIDIRSFTSIVERMEPEAVVTMLSDYIDIVTSAVFKFGGSIDKFLGDGVLAVFGSPIEWPYHARAALAAAAQVRSDLRKWNAERSARGETPLELGMALATGEVVTGTLGRGGQVTYTAVGDTVNLASRLVDLARPGEVLITEETYKGVEPARRADPSVKGPFTLAVRNRDEPVVVYSIYEGRVHVPTKRPQKWADAAELLNMELSEATNVANGNGNVKHDSPEEASMLPFFGIETLQQQAGNKKKAIPSLSKLKRK